MMRIAICDRPNHIEVQSRPIPRLDDKKVLVKVTLCGICGSDLAVWCGKGYQTYPYSPGHEFCGVVEQMGERVAGLQMGQRVVVNPNLGCGVCAYCQVGKPNLCDFLKTRSIKSNGGFSEYVALDYRMVHPLPASFPDELAPFVEPLSCALHAAQSASVERGERVAVFGAGVMGVLTGLALKSSGCEIVFIEPAEKRRRQLANLFDAPPMTPQQLAVSDHVGKLDVAIDCSGRAEAVSQAMRTLRKAGRLVLVGLVTNVQDVGLPLVEVTMKELEIRGVWLNPHTFAEAVRLAVEHADWLGALETAVFALDDIEAAFEHASSLEVNKVLVRP